jgi:Flp pilus assembly protein TadB
MKPISLKSAQRRNSLNMSESIFQTFFLLASFSIALIAVAIANFAVSASYLGRETRLTRSRMEKRKRKLSAKLEELQKKEQQTQIEDLEQEIKKAKKDISNLNSRLFTLSWLGAVVLPSVFLAFPLYLQYLE